MEKSQKLEMIFKDTDGTSSKISVDDPKSDLTEETVRSAMNAIIDASVFETSSGELKRAVGASIITTTEDEFF